MTLHFKEGKSRCREWRHVSKDLTTAPKGMLWNFPSLFSLRVHAQWVYSAPSRLELLNSLNCSSFCFPQASLNGVLVIFQFNTRFRQNSQQFNSLSRPRISCHLDLKKKKRQPKNALPDDPAIPLLDIPKSESSLLWAGLCRNPLPILYVNVLSTTNLRMWLYLEIRSLKR